jgi:ACS family glucarate transporter-like MFS transporter
MALLVSVVPALAAALAWLAIGDLGRPPVGNTSSPVKKPAPGRLASPSLMLLTLSYLLQGYVSYIFVFWFYLYLVQVRHFDVLRGAWFSTLPWLMSIVSIPVGGLVSDRLVQTRLGLTWGRRVVPIAGLAGSALFLAMGAHTGSPRFAAVALAVSTALVLSVEGAFWATMMEIAGERSGTAGGILNMGGNIGGLISPWLTPVLAAAMGWEHALHVAAVLAVIGALLWFRISVSGTPQAMQVFEQS